jgi:hypothetical protein
VSSWPKASGASGRKDLGQRRVSAAGSGFALLLSIRSEGLRADLSKRALRDFRTGTGFADAKLSEILPAARVARFVRMTETALAPLAGTEKGRSLTTGPSSF